MTDHAGGKSALSDELGPLPEPFAHYRERMDVCPVEVGSVLAIDHPLLTGEQMFEHTAAAVAEMRERCAAIARRVADGCTDCDAHYIMDLILKA